VPRGDEYISLKGNSAKKYHMSVTLGYKRIPYSTVKNWVARFRMGHLNNEDEESSGRPTQVTIPENVDAIRFLILNDRKIR
jgi:transposase